MNSKGIENNKVGRPKSPARITAEALGLGKRQVELLGGPDALERMHPEALQFMLSLAKKGRKIA